MDAALSSLDDLRDKPAGTLRLNTPVDAGIRYGEKLEQDMIAVPIGPRIQRFPMAAAPAYLAAMGTPDPAPTISQ
jgi:DNA-binding transcriptional LysR family regulator